jgi:hypothetical protein
LLLLIVLHFVLVCCLLLLLWLLNLWAWSKGPRKKERIRSCQRIPNDEPFYVWRLFRSFSKERDARHERTFAFAFPTKLAWKSLFDQRETH